MFRRKMPEIKSGDVIKYLDDRENYPTKYLLVLISDVRGMMGYPIYEANSSVQIGTKRVDIDPAYIIEIHSCGHVLWDPADLRAIVRGEVDGHGEWDATLMVSQTEVEQRFGCRVLIVEDALYKKLEEANK